jgi:hypothetical protein
MTRNVRVKSEPPRKAAQPERQETEVGIGMAALVYFGLSVLYFLPAFMPGRHIFGSDYTDAGYIMYEFARERIVSGELPKWVPGIMGGLPMFANPGSVFYPVRLIADLILPNTWTLPFIFVLQFGIAGLGMYLLARELGSRSWVALVTGFAFQLTGVIMSAVYAGHDGRVIVATFAPLFFFFLLRGVRTGAFSAFVGTATVLGFALLSFQIQSNYYLLLAGAAWAVYLLIHFDVVKAPTVMARRTALGLGAVAFGFALAAVNFLPFRDYVADSPRGVARGYEYSTGWSIAPAELVGAIVPEHPGYFDSYKGKNPFKLNTEYVGAFVMVMLVLGFGFSRRNRHWWFFLGLTLVTLTIVLGGNTPIYKLYYEFLPGTKRFRAPSLSFFLIALSLSAMAAVTLERIAQLRSERIRGRTSDASPRQRNLLPLMLLGIAIVVIGATVVAAATRGMGGTSQAVAGFGRFALFASAMCLLMYLWWIAALPNRIFVVLISLLTVVDLLLVDRNFFDTVEGPETMFARDPLINFVMSDLEPNRVWIVPSDDGQESNVFMLFGVQQAGGEHGNQLQRWNEYVGRGKTTYIDWHNFLQKSNFVNAANVKYLITRADLKVTGPDTLVLHEVHRGGGWVYQNLKALPRAYMVENVIATRDTMAALKELANDSLDPRKTAVVYTDRDLGLPATPLTGSVKVAEYTPDRVVVRANPNRRTLLVLADNWHKDWSATVNGRSTPVLRANHTFRGVVLEPGQSEVVFRFHPAALYRGFYIYLACLVLLAGYGAWQISLRLRKKTARVD